MRRYLASNLIRAISVTIFYTAIFLYTIIFNTPTGWLLFFFLIVLLLLDLLTLLPSLKKIRVQLTERTTFEVNQLNEIHLDIFRYQPALLRIPLLRIFLKENSSVNEQYLALYSGKKRALVFSLKPTQRGLFNELPVVLVSSDALGVFSKQHTLALAGPFLILPKLQLDLAEALYQQLVTSQSDFFTPYGNKTFSIRNFRKYQVGDSFSLVDWKQSGKRNELIVKEYEHETQADSHFIFYGVAHKNFEELLSIYYSFVCLVEKKLRFQQTLLVESPNSISKEQIMAAAMPLTKEQDLPNFSNKKLVIFAPVKTNQLTEQLEYLKKNNALFLITIDDGKLRLDWQDQVTIIDKGGLSFDQ